MPTPQIPGASAPISVEEAIGLLGSVSEAAETLGVARQTVYNWLGGATPLRVHVRALEAAVGRKVEVL